MIITKDSNPTDHAWLDDMYNEYYSKILDEYAFNNKYKKPSSTDVDYKILCKFINDVGIMHMEDTKMVNEMREYDRRNPRRNIRKNRSAMPRYYKVIDKDKFIRAKLAR